MIDEPLQPSIFRRLFGGGLTIEPARYRLSSTRHTLFFGFLTLAAEAASHLPNMQSSDSPAAQAAMHILFALLGLALLHSREFSADRALRRWSTQGRWCFIPYGRRDGSFADLRFVRFHRWASMRENSVRYFCSIELGVHEQVFTVVSYWSGGDLEHQIWEARRMAAFLDVPLRSSVQHLHGRRIEESEERVKSVGHEPAHKGRVGEHLLWCLIPYLLAPAALAAPLWLAAATGAKEASGLYRDFLPAAAAPSEAVRRRAIACSISNQPATLLPPFDARHDRPHCGEASRAESVVFSMLFKVRFLVVAASAHHDAFGMRRVRVRRSGFVLGA